MPSLNLEVIERFEGLESVSEFDMAIGLLDGGNMIYKRIMRSRTKTRNTL